MCYAFRGISSEKGGVLNDCGVFKRTSVPLIRVLFQFDLPHLGAIQNYRCFKISILFPNCADPPTPNFDFKILMPFSFPSYPYEKFFVVY